MPSVTAPAITGELSCKSPPSARPRQRGRSAPPAPASSRVSAMHRTRKPLLTPTIHSQALRVCDRTICGGPRPHQEPRNLQVSLPYQMPASRGRDDGGHSARPGTKSSHRPCARPALRTSRGRYRLPTSVRPAQWPLHASPAGAPNPTSSPSAMAQGSGVVD